MIANTSKVVRAEVNEFELRLERRERLHMNMQKNRQFITGSHRFLQGVTLV